MTKETIEYLPVAAIDTGPQVRENAVDDSIRNLAVTLREVGLQQPIRVRRNGNRLVVVDGERRLHAARLLKWDRIAAIVEERDLSGAEIVQLQLIANLLRKNLSGMETARRNRWPDERNKLVGDGSRGKTRYQHRDGEQVACIARSSVRRAGTGAEWIARAKHSLRAWKDSRSGGTDGARPSSGEWSTHARRGECQSEATEPPSQRQEALAPVQYYGSRRQPPCECFRGGIQWTR